MGQNSYNELKEENINNITQPQPPLNLIHGPIPIYTAIQVTPNTQEISIEPILEGSILKTFCGFKNQLPPPLNGFLTQEEFQKYIDQINTIFKSNFKARNIFIILIFIFFLIFILGLLIIPLRANYMSPETPLIYYSIVGVFFFILSISLIVLVIKTRTRVINEITNINNELQNRGIFFTLVCKRHHQHKIGGKHKYNPYTKLYVSFPMVITTSTFATPVYQQHPSSYQIYNNNFNQYQPYVYEQQQNFNYQNDNNINNNNNNNNNISNPNLYNYNS